ncbi:hypothetical protein [Salinarimonas soli]|uniref:Uncharacterized protein n=1 Tax=Salinarimonas soli TaxID=1638099 RepID=A0A5B2V8X7_9HYPH|nr:hypothetical protein [Salinarimonas soli]KAA2234789.1 hypothetical protein F0L46_22840 [Salinarimonas soli]
MVPTNPLFSRMFPLVLRPPPSVPLYFVRHFVLSVGPASSPVICVFVLVEVGPRAAWQLAASTPAASVDQVPEQITELDEELTFPGACSVRLRVKRQCGPSG